MWINYPPTTLIHTVLPKSHSTIAMEMSQREKRPIILIIITAIAGNVPTILYYGMGPLLENTLNFTMETRVRAASMFYNHPELFCPK